MAHPRKRHLLPLLLKKLKFSPIVAIQGARQTGKSFLARTLLGADLKGIHYVTLDELPLRELATKSPSLFLSQFEGSRPLVIDEAQKSPPLFDELKRVVDLSRVSGRYLLLGSTEFSKLSLIRESLTGRMSRVRLYPLNLAETLGLSPSKSNHPLLLEVKPRITRSQWVTYLARGGMPGIFTIRNAEERKSQLNDWLELTAKRDAVLFPKLKVEPELCMRILEKIATLEEPDAGSIARALKRDVRRVKTHLEVLSTLFVIHALEPHPSGTGKAIYFIADCALANLLGASLERRMHTGVLLEQLSQRAYRDDREARLYYYRSPKGRIIHLVVEKGQELSALKISTEERLDLRELEILTAFKKRNPKQKINLVYLSGQRLSLPKIGVEVYPWESMG